MDLQLETMQPLAISIAELPDDCKSWPETKEKWGDKVVLCGAIEPARYAFLGTPDEMKEECKKWIDMMAGGGNYFLSLGCEFPPNGSLLNATAMVEAAEMYGRYS
jgi:uroporphyrinogen decarboxylase